MSTLRARRFLEAFSAAAYDAELERKGYAVYHFFDSDFLGRLIFGFQDTLNHALIQETKARRAGSIAGQRLLMGALVGQGIGAPPLMRALLPHLYEVRRSVEGPRLHEPQRSVKLVMDELGIEQSLDDLQDALEASATPDDLLAHFLDQGPQIFYGAELLSGRWESRLGRVLALGIREKGPFDDDPEVVGSEAFEALAKHVVNARDTNGSGAVRGLRDAMALATLAQAVARADDGKAVARFYTETPRIHNAWRDSAEMRALLTYGAPDLEDYGAHGVLRTVDYYLVRALIPELAYERAPSDDRARPETSGMYKIADDLAEAAKHLHCGGVGEAELSSMRIGEATLGEFMAELSDLSSYDTTWRALMRKIPSGLPRQLVRQLKEVRAGERLRAGDLDESFQKHLKQLSSRTREVGEFTDAYVHLLDVLTRWHGEVRPWFGNFSEHFGLTRWGLVPADADEAALLALIESYEEWSADRHTAGGGELSTARAGFVIEIAQRLRDMGTAPHRGADQLAHCVTLLGFLWLIGDYRSIVKYGRDLLKAITVHAESKSADARWTAYGRVVTNLCGAAEVKAVVARARGPLHGDAADDLLARTREILTRLDEAERTFGSNREARAVTQGYVLFEAWLAFNSKVMLNGAAKPRQPSLLKESLKVCFDALETCDPDAPMYALLLNHCVYVASMAKLVDERITNLAKELGLVRLSERQAMSYRLDDTLGYYYYVRAAKTVAEHTGNGEADPRRTASAGEDLKLARRWLDRVPTKVNDAEIEAHRLLLRELEQQLSL